MDMDQLLNNTDKVEIEVNFCKDQNKSSKSSPKVFNSMGSECDANDHITLTRDEKDNNNTVLYINNNNKKNQKMQTLDNIKFILREESDDELENDLESGGSGGDIITGSNQDLEPTLGEPEPEATSVSPIQRCLFCSRTFRLEQDLILHLDGCNSILKKIVCTRKRQCLVCRRKIASFSICGLIRHAITCVIEERERLLINKDLLQNPTPSKIQVPPVNNDNVAPLQNDEKPTFPVVSTRFHSQQTSILNSFFKKKKFPNVDDKLYLVRKTGLTQLQVKNWFERQRYRLYWTHSKVYPKSKEQMEIIIKRAYKEKNKKVKYPPKIACILNSFFNENMYPNKNEKEELARKTKLSMQQILDWFSNKKKFIRKKLIPHSQKLKPIAEESSLNKPKRLEFRAACKKIRESVNSETISSSNASQYSESVFNVLKERFQTNDRPGALELIELSNKTGLSTTIIRKWLNKRRQRKTDIKHKFKLTSPKIENEDSISLEDELQNEIQETEEDFDFDYDEDIKPEVLLKDMPKRRKFAAIKKIAEEQFDSYLASVRPSILTLLKLYSEIGEDSREAISLESSTLGKAFELNNPFSPLQIEKIQILEEDLVVSLYPLQSGNEWISIVNAFYHQVLKTWLPILIYSKILDVSLEEGAIEMYHIYLGRNEKPVEQRWTIPAMLY